MKQKWLNILFRVFCIGKKVENYDNPQRIMANVIHIRTSNKIVQWMLVDSQLSLERQNCLAFAVTGLVRCCWFLAILGIIIWLSLWITLGIIMDYVYTNLLSAEDMRRILKQRELRIPDIEHMTYEELQQIFKSYAVPLLQRGERKHKTDLNSEPEHNFSKLKRALPPPVDQCASKLSRVTLNVNVSETFDSLGKRKSECNSHTATHSINKRLKITWP